MPFETTMQTATPVFQRSRQYISSHKQSPMKKGASYPLSRTHTTLVSLAATTENLRKTFKWNVLAKEFVPSWLAPVDEHETDRTGCMFSLDMLRLLNSSLAQSYARRQEVVEADSFGCCFTPDMISQLNINLAESYARRQLAEDLKSSVVENTEEIIEEKQVLIESASPSHVAAIFDEVPVKDISVISVESAVEANIHPLQQSVSESIAQVSASAFTENKQEYIEHAATLCKEQLDDHDDGNSLLEEKSHMIKQHSTAEESVQGGRENNRHSGQELGMRVTLEQLFASSVPSEIDEDVGCETAIIEWLESEVGKMRVEFGWGSIFKEVEKRSDVESREYCALCDAYVLV